MTRWHIHNEDALDFAARYDGEPFHALLCDPPYELGFMGKSWDKSGVVFKPETWAAFARLLHPGAFGMAFASSRGWHRLACAIEDAGLVIHPSIFGWGFGSGFPKATRVDTQVDEAAGAEREAIASPWDSRKPNGSASRFSVGLNATAGAGQTAPATDLARAWAGHRYGLQALKPALEPIIVFQRSYSGKPVDCITATGAGALNVDGGRIAGESVRTTRNIALGSSSGGIYSPANTPAVFESHPAGRWPANLTLSHSPACNGVCAPECAVLRLGQQSGESVSSVRVALDKDEVVSTWGLGRKGITPRGHADTGTAARFFFNAQYEQIDAADPVRYNAKASRKERDAGLEGMPERVISRYGEMNTQGPRPQNTPRMETPQRNPHPTVKPIALIRHLATLLLPPAEYAPRRILIPFAGSGSEMIGAGLAGWDEIVGIEREAEYAEIAERRLAHWLTETSEGAPVAQPELFEAYG